MIATTKPAADVIVIGGGPAGTTTATLLAKAGHDVVLFEREHFPRFHIGESFIPETHHPLKRLGMIDKLKSSHFVKKYSVQFVTDMGKLSEPFYFWDYKPQESSQTWQVRRDEFDHMMLTNARENGVDVHEGARVMDVLFEGARATGVRVKLDNGETREVSAKVVVDATGQSSFLIGKLGLREWDKDLKKAAVWTYFKGAQRESGRDEGATLVMQTKGKKGWFWYIPLHDDIVSVGVVSDHDHLFNRANKDFESIFQSEVEACPGVQPRIANATRCDQFYAQKEYSYKTRQGSGDGWVMVGDAFGFLDPLYSSGVLLALLSGEKAADAIAEGLATGNTSGEKLGQWIPSFTRGMERMKKLVVAFYDGFNFGQFVRKHPEKKDLITDVLIGDLYKDQIDELWPLIEQMKQERLHETAPAAS